MQKNLFQGFPVLQRSTLLYIPLKQTTNSQRFNCNILVQIDNKEKNSKIYLKCITRIQCVICHKLAQIYQT